MKRKIFSVLTALVVVMSFSVVMAVPVSAATWNVPGDYGTIQEAIDAAGPGDIITVDAGSYTESLAINKGLTIQGAGSSTTTITGAHTVSASSVSLADFTLTLSGSGIVVKIDSSSAALSNISVTSCVLTMGTSPSIGVSIGYGIGSSPNAVSNVTMDGNTFNGPSNDIANPWKIGGQFGSPVGCQVTNVDFTNNTVNDCSIPINLHDQDITDILVDCNTFSGTDGALYVWEDAAAGPTGVLSDFVFTNNDLSASNSYGVGIDTAPNEFTDANFGTGNRINYNDFSGCGLTYGFGAVSILSTLTSYELDATNNYWGSTTGPTHSSNVAFNASTARGTTVSDDVDFVPWYDTDMTGSSLAPVTVGTSTTYHASIQAGIDAASAGDTITCATGQFDEDLTVNTADLTLKSAAGSTTIQLVTGVGIDIQGGASGFTLGGASGEGFTIDDDDAATTFNIQLANGPSDVEISHNTIDSSGGFASMAVSVGAAGASGLTISNNTISVGTGGIWGPNVADVTVSNNDISGGSYGVQFSGVTGTSSIDNNDISSCTGAGGVVISNGAGTSGLTITNNTIMGCGNGIYFVEYCAEGTAADMTTVTVTYNYISGSTNDAIKITAGTHVLASNFVIMYNAFIGSTSYGLENQHSSEQVTAEWNWWDFAGGPDDEPGKNPYDTQANTAGAEVCTALVDFTPWMIHTSLASGWNIFSTPIASGASTNTIAEALDFWGSDSSLVTAAYYFNSATQTWAVASSLDPLQAVYLNLSDAAAIDILMSTGNTAPPARTMHQGWNLVGPAELYDMPVDDAVSSAEYGTGQANLVGYNHVMSPSINQAAWTFLRSDTYNDEDFVPTEGYWVFMVNQGMLGGFTYTPITPLP